MTLVRKFLTLSTVFPVQMGKLKAASAIEGDSQIEKLAIRKVSRWEKLTTNDKLGGLYNGHPRKLPTPRNGNHASGVLHRPWRPRHRLLPKLVRERAGPRRCAGNGADARPTSGVGRPTHMPHEAFKTVKQRYLPQEEGPLEA